MGTNKTKKRKIYTYSINYQSNILFQRICQESGKCIDRRYSALFLLLVMTRVDNCKLLQILSGMFMTVNTASRACKSIAIKKNSGGIQRRQKQWGEAASCQRLGLIHRKVYRVLCVLTIAFQRCSPTVVHCQFQPD